MFTSAELIEALRRRMRKSLRPDRLPGEFPPGWNAWFASLAERVGAVTGATADAIIAIFLQREPALPERAGAHLNRWRAFATLWRQQWHPTSRDERSMRIVAYVITLLVHLIMAVLLVWLAYVRFALPPSASDEVAVRMQFIGEGTPEDEGGGPPSPSPDTVIEPSTAKAQPRPPRPTLTEVQEAASAIEAPAAPEVPRETPKLVEEAAPPPAEQTLQVTETSKVPDEARFRLPPPQPRTIDTPAQQVRVPALSSQIEALPSPRPAAPVRPIDRDMPPREISVPQLVQQPTEIVTPQPLPAVRALDIPQQATATSQLQVPESNAEPQSLPMPPGASAPVADAAVNVAKASGTPEATPSPALGAQPAAAAAGTTAASRPGAAPTAKRADDWGDAARNVAGQPRGSEQRGKGPGLYNADGSLRLPPGVGPPKDYGAPPGSVEEHIADLDRAGKWLDGPRKRYEPTMFDKYWVPNETLLQEWVRRGIRKLSIPIPGTSKRIECLVSLLQVGGGCGVTDSEKLFDQPAVARPSPDIPFKPELQEDQDALKKP